LFASAATEALISGCFDFLERLLLLRVNLERLLLALTAEAPSLRIWSSL